MNSIEAELLVKKIITAFESNQDANSILNYYTDDVVGHIDNKIFKKEDIRNRINYMQKRYPKRKFFYENVINFDNTLIFKSIQTFYDEMLKKPSRSELTVVYQLEEKTKKVKQWWLISDYKMNYLIKEGDHPKTEDMSIDIKCQRDFFKYMQTYSLYYDLDSVELSQRKLECLYYFLNGYTAKETSKILDISHRTVESYIKNIKEKYNCTSRDELRKLIFPD